MHNHDGPIADADLQCFSRAVKEGHIGRNVHFMPIFHFKDFTKRCLDCAELIFCFNVPFGNVMPSFERKQTCTLTGLYSVYFRGSSIN